MTNDSLGDRMKTYETVSKNFLVRRMPVIIRLDGKAFHTYTKKLLKQLDPNKEDAPYNTQLHNIMVETMMFLCNNIQNVKFGYTQSDEISLLLIDYEKLTTEQWFKGNIQKMASVSASLATGYFNYLVQSLSLVDEDVKLPLAFFDSRVYNIPKEEVANYMLWRQKDATRNSIQMFGHFHFGHKKLHKKSNKDILDLLIEEKHINWNSEHTWKKRGTVIRKDDNSFVLDEQIPIFSTDRDYIEQYL